MKDRLLILRKSNLLSHLSHLSAHHPTIHSSTQTPSSICQFTHLSIHLSLHPLTLHLPIYYFTHLSVHLCIHSSKYFNNILIHQFINLFIHPSTHPSSTHPSKVNFPRNKHKTKILTQVNDLFRECSQKKPV